MKNNVLSIKQMQKLKELGIDTSKASMCYVFFESDDSKYVDIVVHDESCYEMACMNPMPTFTLQDVIEFMPESFKHDGNIYYLEIHKNSIEYTEYEKYESMYVSNEISIINNAYNTLIWLLKNKYI